MKNCSRLERRIAEHLGKLDEYTTEFERLQKLWSSNLQ